MATHNFNLREYWETMKTGDHWIYNNAELVEYVNSKTMMDAYYRSIITRLGLNKKWYVVEIDSFPDLSLEELETEYVRWGRLTIKARTVEIDYRLTHSFIISSNWHYV